MSIDQGLVMEIAQEVVKRGKEQDGDYLKTLHQILKERSKNGPLELRHLSGYILSEVGRMVCAGKNNTLPA